MCFAQLGELEPADDVLGGHLFDRLSQGLVDGILVPAATRRRYALTFDQSLSIGV